MKKIYSILFLTCSLIFASCLKDIEHYGYYDNTICQGIVVEEFTNQPLANVRVCVSDGLIIDNEVLTKADGTFEIPVSADKLRNDYYIIFFYDSLRQEYLVSVSDIPLGSQYFQIDTVFFVGQQLPYVGRPSVSEISATSAYCSSSVYSDGFSAITEKGFVYDTIKYPTLSNHSVQSGDNGNNFSATIDIQPNTRYFVRAYARNAIGVSYSEPMEFSSASILPVVTTSDVASITATTAVCGGNVETDGGSKLIGRGLCWSTTPNPSLNNSHLEVGYTTGEFSATISGLRPETQYYIRAYAQNESGTSYGNQQVFTTLSGLPVVITAEPTSVSTTSAVVGGEVVSDAGIMVIHRGICYSTRPQPTINGPHTTDGSGLGTFESNLLGLSVGVTYYYRAYATNGFGTTYGEQKTIVTH